MDNSLKNFEQEFSLALQQASTREEMETVEREFLGRNGKLQNLFEQMVTLPTDQKKAWGQKLNKLKQESFSQVEMK
jgi:phenylalanyl-tRNA synthetase alpha chain